eukprot:7857711-Alexandrium_andersonii.AAC.1
MGGGGGKVRGCVGLPSEWPLGWKPSLRLELSAKLRCGAFKAALQYKLSTFRRTIQRPSHPPRPSLTQRCSGVPEANPLPTLMRFV